MNRKQAFLIVGAIAGFFAGFLGDPSPDLFTGCIFGIGGALLGLLIGAALYWWTKSRRS